MMDDPPENHAHGAGRNGGDGESLKDKYNLRLILTWLRRFLRLILIAIRDVSSPPSALIQTS